MRNIFVSDIHGYFPEFEALLKEIGGSLGAFILETHELVLMNDGNEPLLPFVKKEE